MGYDFFDCDICIGLRGIAYPGSYNIGDIGDENGCYGGECSGVGGGGEYSGVGGKCGGSGSGSGGRAATDWLAAAMRHYGISRALVYHSMARENNAELGNRMLAEDISGMNNLLPVWIVMPHHTEEFINPRELPGKMKAAGVKAVRMFPSEQEQNYGLNERNCGELFSMFENHEIPLLIGKDQMSWDELCAICERHKNLKIILCNLTYSMNRNLYPILSLHSNIFLETYGYKVQNGIEEICRLFGAERLIFGSGMPRLSGAAAVSMITYARISDEEKKLIAYGNLDALISGVIF